MTISLKAERGGPLYPIKLMCLQGSRGYSQKVAAHLGLPLTEAVERQFDDGEVYVKSNSKTEGNVRGCRVFVIASLFSDCQETVSEKFVKLCMLCHSLKQASAAEVIPVVPHLAWARQDRKTESRAPIATKTVARMLEAVEISRILVMDVHNLAAEQNAFNVPLDNLECKNLHAAWCADQLLAKYPHLPVKLRVLTPDSGGLNRCTRFRNALVKSLELRLGQSLAERGVDIEIAIFDKIRSSGQITGRRIVGDVSGAVVIAYDDIISTGSTMFTSCRTVEQFGGQLFACVATHGLFVGAANDYFRQLDAHLVVSDTVDPFRLSEENRRKLSIVDTSAMVAEAIARIHNGSGSISELLTQTR